MVGCRDHMSRVQEGSGGDTSTLSRVVGVNMLKTACGNSILNYS